MPHLATPVARQGVPAQDTKPNRRRVRFGSLPGLREQISAFPQAARVAHALPPCWFDRATRTLCAVAATDPITAGAQLSRRARDALQLPLLTQHADAFFPHGVDKRTMNPGFSLRELKP
eukprot:6202347-Pleurochrysis_carterae.AAC.4